MKINVTYRLFTISLFIILLIRVFLGVELTDESQYVSQAIQPFIGDGFFKHDLFVQQFIYVIFSPLTNLYYSFFSSEGIVLLFRLCYLALTLLSSYLIFNTLKGYLDEKKALLSSISLLSFIPFSVPSISYNTVLYIFLPLLLILLIIVEKLNLFQFMLTSLLTFLLCIAYPTIGILFFIISVYLFYIKRHRNLLALILGGILSLVLVAIYIEELPKSIQFSSSFNRPSPHEKLLMIWTMGKYLLIVFCQSVLISFWIKRKDKWIFPATLILLLINLFLFQKTAHPGHSFILICASMFLPGIFFIKIRKNFLHLLIFFIISSFLLAYTSSNGLTNAPLSLLVPITIASGYYFDKKRSLLLNGLMLFFLSISNYFYFYREANLIELDSLIKSGPFKGLITSSERKLELSKIGRLLNNNSIEEETGILSLGSPAIYLYSSFKPITKMLFIHHGTLPKKVLNLIADCDLLSSKPKFIFIHHSVSKNTIKAFDECLNLNRNYSSLPNTTYFKVLHLSTGSRR
ncbi:MAG: hypothetical protein CME65_04475 [Halobacteriovoraceae bacterium]|nr:hypothetical protein [Halobacteriovoraceae bacterium]|tara:strand:- start:11551 stop:13104 length:1554 start_codon:yes stop_codon:yes gene_type:complete